MLAAFGLAVGAAPSNASVTLGEVGSTSPGCTANLDMAQTGVASGPSYTVPGDGTITSWSHNAPTGPSQTFTMKIYRAVPDQPGFFMVVGHDGPRDQPQNLLNTFQTNIPVRAGDFLGLDTANGASGCTINMGFTSADTFVVKNAPPPLGDGQSGLFNPAGTGRLDVSAVFQPSNTVTVGSTVLNKKKGTATLNLTLPNPGDLTASGSGVSAASAGHARISKAVTPGATQLLIQATGKKRKTLNQKGKVTLTVAITYTPTNGAPGTQSVQVKLKKKLKKK